jgi:integrase
VTKSSEGDVTFRTMDRKLTAWLRHAGDLADLRLADLKVPDVREWRDGLPRSRDAEFAELALRQALEVAVQDELLASNPLKSLKRRTPKRRTAAEGQGARRVKVYSAEELGALKRAGSKQWIGRLVVLMSDTGLRPAEARGLMWGDIDGDVLHVRRQLYEYGNELRLIPELKTDNSLRSIYIDPQTVAALGRPGTDDELVFPDSREGLQRKKRCNDAFARLHAQAGLERDGRTLHCLRHTHASQLLTAGVPLGDVAVRLGDTIRTVLLYYSHWVPGEDRSRDAVRAMAGAG